MNRGLYDTVIEIGQTLSRDKAEKVARAAIQRGFDVSCTVDGWKIYHVKTGYLDRVEALGIYHRLQKAGFTPVMM